MLILSGFLKPFHQVMILFTIAVCVSDVSIASPLHAQPMGHPVTAHALPPLHFPKDDYDEDTQPDLSRVLPPKVFPKISDETEEHHDSAVTSLSTSTEGLNKNTEKTTVPTTKVASALKLASEVPDMLNADGFNRTVYEDGSETPIQNDTVTVTGPNVINNGKTHEEDGTVSSVEDKEADGKNKTVEQSVPDEKNDTAAVFSPPSATDTDQEGDQNSTVAVAVHEEQGSVPDSSNVTESTQSSIETSVTTEADGEKSATVSQELSEMDSNATTSSSTNPEGVPAVEDGKKKTESPDESKEKKVKTKSDNRTDKKDKVIKPEPPSKETEPTKATTAKQDAEEATTVAVKPDLKDEVETVPGITQNTSSHEEVQDSPIALAASQQHADHSHASTGKSSAFLQPTESAAILAGVFVGIALLGYVGLLVWRKILEKRYGNREMLVNEDDFYDTNDLRNFEL